MSYKLMGQLFELLLPRCQKDILRILCDSADDVPQQSGIGINSYPSIPVVAWKSDYSERQVQRLQRELEMQGILIPVRVHPIYGTTEFEIHLEHVPKKPPFEVKKPRARGGRNGLSRGDMVSPLEATSVHPSGRQNATPSGEGGDTPRGAKIPHQGVTKTAFRGDRVSPDPSYIPGPLPKEDGSSLKEPSPPRQPAVFSEETQHGNRKPTFAEINTRAAQDFVRRELAKTVQPGLPDVRKKSH
jgi:hypothetical protein